MIVYNGHNYCVGQLADPDCTDYYPYYRWYEWASFIDYKDAEKYLESKTQKKNT
jgi:hypothetical protein